MARSLVLFSIVVLIGAVFLTVPASATEMKNGAVVTVPSGTVIPDDLLMSGNNVSMDGKVDGDLLAFGAQISVPGQVTMDAMLAGSNVNVSGRVGDDIRAAGGTVTLSSPVAKNGALAGGTVTIDKNGSIGRDLQVAGGTIIIDGKVARNLQVAGGQVTLNGVVGGDVTGQVGKLVLGPTALIRGNLIYQSQQEATMQPGARVLGKKQFTQVQNRPGYGHRRGPGAGLALFSLLALFVTGAILLAIMPRESDAIASTAVSRPWSSLLIGFLALIAVPVAVLILMITVVGLPIALILLAAYLISLYISYVFAGLAIGGLLLRGTPEAPSSRYLRLLIGLVIIVVLSALLSYVPVLGGLFRFVVLLIGFGALLSERYRLVRQLRGEGRV